MTIVSGLGDKPVFLRASTAQCLPVLFVNELREQYTLKANVRQQFESCCANNCDNPLSRFCRPPPLPHIPPCKKRKRYRIRQHVWRKCREGP